jgi:hypothetical protein
MHRFLGDNVPTWHPDPGGLPGIGTFSDLVNAIGYIALFCCLAAAILGGVTWAFGSSSSNAAAATRGQKMVVGAIAGAVVIGAANILIQRFYNIGVQLH